MDNAYRFLSAYYDRFTDDVGYAEWADYFEKIFGHAGVKPELVLDLACGTGSLSAEMAGRGYEMIGVDASADMLSQAMNRSVGLSPRPIFLQQKMERLDLYGTVGACLCCLDSINYVTDSVAVQETFRRVELFLDPGGIFVFDINTPAKFERMNGEYYVREDEDVYCAWQVTVENSLCTYTFDIFEKTGENTWARAQETHTERIYQIGEVETMLKHAGFSDMHIYAPLSFNAPVGTEDRVFFTARKRK